MLRSRAAEESWAKIIIQSGKENKRETRETIFRKGDLCKREESQEAKRGGRGVILVLCFINFLAISAGVVESKDKETCSLAIPLG